MKRRGVLGLMALILAALALVAAGCGGDDEDEGAGGTTATETTGGGSTSGVTALPSSSCTKVEYGGDGDAKYLIVSDLPMQGSSRTQTVQMVKAIRYILEQRNWKAGEHNIAYQVCDDATAQAAKWDSGKCSQNAQAYAGNDDVIGVIGTFNSGCAQIEIPVLNQAPGGAVAMVSPANTFPCLTVGAGCESTEPDKYYPTGKRNYARVVPYDAYQAAIQADFMKSVGVKKLYVLNDKEAYGLAVATLTRRAAQEVGIQVVGFSAWAKESASYEAIMRKVKSSGADALFLGGLVDENGAQVIKDKVAVLGPNNGKVKLFAPDGFTQQSTIDESGVKNAKDMYMSVAGGALDNLKGEGKTFLDGFKKQLGNEPADPYSVYGAQAAEVLLAAIERSDGTRASVVEELFKTKVKDGILGTFNINENGDVAQGKGVVIKYTMYKAAKELEVVKELTPRQELADATLEGSS
ncbi:MAG: branched-chain amino acid ABC transporter substrate-binding protein [Actinobacteria bacterium]|nr:branched-chain amino acid ABC transporter substrate-binding protein [Actinomycetota bacterium]